VDGRIVAARLPVPRLKFRDESQWSGEVEESNHELGEFGEFLWRGTAEARRSRRDAELLGRWRGALEARDPIRVNSWIFVAIRVGGILGTRIFTNETRIGTKGWGGGGEGTANFANFANWFLEGWGVRGWGD
jgi:hypothetical protein